MDNIQYVKTTKINTYNLKLHINIIDSSISTLKGLLHNLYRYIVSSE